MIFEDLRRGVPVTDETFDRIYPPDLRELSKTHFTPVPVARRAAHLLCGDRADLKVLDIGSGLGKFCMVASAVTSQARFFGVEQRPHFVRLSRNLLEEYQVPRVEYVHANLCDLDWSAFGGFYLFNPFQENMTPDDRIDGTVPLGCELFERYVARTEEKLRAMPAGARVVTYHGFGGAMPGSYVRTHREYAQSGWLELWLKIR